jgi:hypothetical protein
MKLLFKFHNEHRIALVRFLAWFSSFFGQLNFKFILLFGNFSFLILFYFIGKSLQKPFFYLIIALLLFQLQSWDNAFWPMASICNFWVYVWAFAALASLLNKNQYSVFLAIIFGLFATFTTGNGLFVFPVGSLALLILKDYKRFTIWTISGLFVIAFYLIGIGASHPAQPNASFARTPVNILQFFFSFVGSNFWVPLSKYISMGFGLLLSGSFWVFIGLKYHKKNLLLTSFLAFLLLTAAVVAWNRYLIGTDLPLSSRYRICSTLIAILVVVIWLDILIERWPSFSKIFIGLTIFAALGFNLVSNFMYFNRVKELKNNRLLEAWLSQTHHRITGHYKPEEAYQILTKAKEAKLFEMPAVTPNTFFYSAILDLKTKPQNIDYQIDSLCAFKKFKTIEGWAVAAGYKDNLSQIYVLLKAKNQPDIYFKTVPMKRYDLIKLKGKPLNYIESGFMAFVPDSLLKADTYQIGIAIKPKLGQAGLVMTNRVLTH